MINSHRAYLMPIDSTLMPDPTVDGAAKSCTISAGRNVTPGPSIHLFHSTSAKLGRVPDGRPCSPDHEPFETGAILLDSSL